MSYRCGPLPCGGAGPAYSVTATPPVVDTFNGEEEEEELEELPR